MKRSAIVRRIDKMAGPALRLFGRSRMHWEMDAKGRVWCCVKFRKDIRRRGKRMAYWYKPTQDRMLWYTPPIGFAV